MSQTDMNDSTTHRVVPTKEARQGETSGHVRWVLHISVALAVIAGIVVYLVV